MPAIVEALRDRISLLEGRRVVVLGDPVLDVYVHGTTLRISREAPVPIVREEKREHRLGGAANAAANVAALGGKTCLVGLVGKDAAASELVAIAHAQGIDPRGLVEAESLCTLTKTRILAGGLHTTRQQLLRIDRENAAPPEDADRASLVARAREIMSTADALIISDYGDGAMSPAYAEVAREAITGGRVVVVDSRHTLTAFRGVTAVTPNEPEVEIALGVALRTPEDAVRAAEHVLAELELSSMLLTRGHEGMAVARSSGPSFLLAAHGAKDAVDVTGAGDTVTATYTLALTAGASELEAAVLANCAAAIVVQKVGTATCSPAELLAAIESLSHETMLAIQGDGAKAL